MEEAAEFGEGEKDDFMYFITIKLNFEIIIDTHVVVETIQRFSTFFAFFNGSIL
jgi:hypothetical protein